MQRELWYPSLQPPWQHLMLSVIYSDGFASVLPSWSLRETHAEWRGLEAAEEAGLYEPIRLREALADPGLVEPVRARLRWLAHTVRMDPTAAPRLRAWSQHVLGGQPTVSTGERPRPTDSQGPGSDTEASFELLVLSSQPPRVGKALLEELGFEMIDSRYCRAPQEVVDALVETIALHRATADERYVPTTYSGQRDRGPTATGFAWHFLLPSPQPTWTLADALRFRQREEELLGRIRQRMSSAGPPDSAKDAAQQQAELKELLGRDLKRLDKAMGADSRRLVRKSMVLPLAAAVAAQAIPDLGFVGNVGLDLVMGAAEPVAVATITAHVSRAAIRYRRMRVGATP